MTLLVWTLRVKIAGTLLLWCVPLIAFPAAWFVRLGFPEPRPLLFARLLGLAYLSLLVAYAHGLLALERGGDAKPAVCVGIASNGLAGIALFAFVLAGGASEWGAAARAFLLASAAGAFAITAALTASRRALRREGPQPDSGALAGRSPAASS